MAEDYILRKVWLSIFTVMLVKTSIQYTIVFTGFWHTPE